jgi:hypothetical protein
MSLSPAFALFGSDLENGRVTFAIRELFLPGFSLVAHDLSIRANYDASGN